MNEFINDLKSLKKVVNDSHKFLAAEYPCNTDIFLAFQLIYSEFERIEADMATKNQSRLNEINESYDKVLADLNKAKESAQTIVDMCNVILGNCEKVKKVEK